MDGGAFTLEIVTPSERFSREVLSIRLRDATGHFGVMKGHASFLAVLVPSLGYYHDPGGRERYLAVDGGIFQVRGGRAILTTREAFEGDDARIMAEAIERTVSRRDADELAFSKAVEGIERAFIEKSAALARENP